MIMEIEIALLITIWFFGGLINYTVGKYAPNGFVLVILCWVLAVAVMGLIVEFLPLLNALLLVTLPVLFITILCVAFLNGNSNSQILKKEYKVIMKTRGQIWCWKTLGEAFPLSHLQEAERRKVSSIVSWNISKHITSVGSSTTIRILRLPKWPIPCFKIVGTSSISSPLIPFMTGSIQ